MNPWDAPQSIKTVNGTDWTVISFSNTNLKDNYVGIYDDADEIAFALKFKDLPDWGNIGALGEQTD